MIKIENRQVYSTDNRFVHRIGTDSYFKRSTTLPTDTESSFEEVDELPPYTKAEYDAKVAEMVRQRYTESEEFAIQRKMLNLMLTPAVMSDRGESEADKTMTEYAAYNDYVEQCKADAKNPDLYKSPDTEQP